MTERTIWTDVKEAVMKLAAFLRRKAETTAMDETRMRSRTPVDKQTDDRRDDDRGNDHRRDDERPTGDPRDPRGTGG